MIKWLKQFFTNNELIKAEDIDDRKGFEHFYLSRNDQEGTKIFRINAMVIPEFRAEIERQRKEREKNKK